MKSFIKAIASSKKTHNVKKHGKKMRYTPLYGEVRNLSRKIAMLHMVR